jgi:hypothetical protein
VTHHLYDAAAREWVRVPARDYWWHLRDADRHPDHYEGWLFLRLRRR